MISVVASRALRAFLLGFWSLGQGPKVPVRFTWGFEFSIQRHRTSDGHMSWQQHSAESHPKHLWCVCTGWAS